MVQPPSMCSAILASVVHSTFHGPANDSHSHGTGSSGVVGRFCAMGGAPACSEKDKSHSRCRETKQAAKRYLMRGRLRKPPFEGKAVSESGFSGFFYFPSVALSSLFFR